MPFNIKVSTQTVKESSLNHKLDSKRKFILGANQSTDHDSGIYINPTEGLTSNSQPEQQTEESSVAATGSPVLLNEDERKRNKFYLPVLYINDATMWPSLPVSERKNFTDQVAYDTCLGNCCGVKDLKGACCQLDPDNIEHVLGPVDEPWIKRIIKVLRKNGQTVSRRDIVIDLEEGKLIGDKFFHSHPVFHSPNSYPMLRFQVYGPRFACKFFNSVTAKCTIYEHRSDMCSSYLCNYVKTNFMIKTKDHPNRFVKYQ